MPRPATRCAYALLARVLLLHGLLGCGRSPETTGAVREAGAPAGSEAGTAAVRWVECTEASRAPMEARLLALHGLERLDDPDGLRCITVQLADGPAFFVELVGTAGDRRRRLHGVVAIDGVTERVPLRDARFEWAVLLGGKVAFETIDLDGDGADEVIVHYDDRRQLASEWFDVIVIRGQTLRELAGPRISYEDPDLDERCRGVLGRERADLGVELVITTRESTGRSEHCLERGRHVFALAAGRLVER